MTFLSYRISISRGRDTYGYNIVTLTDTDTGKKYKTCGGGYDMLGTVFGEFLRASDKWPDICKLTPNHGSLDKRQGYYGLTDYDGKRGIDGACGFSCMKGIAEAVGLKVETIHDKRNRRNYKLIGIQVS